MRDLDAIRRQSAGTDPKDIDTDQDGMIDSIDPVPATPSNLCNGNHALLQDTIVHAGDLTTCAASTSIDVAGTVQVQAGG